MAPGNFTTLRILVAVTLAAQALLPDRARAQAAGTTTVVIKYAYITPIKNRIRWTIEAKFLNDNRVEETVSSSTGSKWTSTGMLGANSSWAVVDASTLRRTIDHPNHLFITTVKVKDLSCEVDIDSKLKPGKQTYVFVVGATKSSEFADKPQYDEFSCSIK